MIIRERQLELNMIHEDNSLLPVTSRQDNQSLEESITRRRPRGQIELSISEVDINERASRLAAQSKLFNHQSHKQQQQAVTSTPTTVMRHCCCRDKQSCKYNTRKQQINLKMPTFKMNSRRSSSLLPHEMISFRKANEQYPLIGCGYDERKRFTAKIINNHRHFNNFHSFMAILFVASLGTTLITTITATTTLAATSTTTLQQQHQTSTVPSASNGVITSTNFRNNEQTANSSGATSVAGQLHRASGDNSNNGDINRLRPIEQVAKAEALTSGESAQSVSQQQASTRMFDMCKVQSKIGQQLTNLSQIMFQPSEICSTWSKMSKTVQQIDSSSSMDTASSYPWHFIEQLNLSHNNLTVLHDSSGMSRLVNLIELKITHNQLSRCEESSLFGLQRLQILDLSHNRLMALPAKFFQPVKQTIKKLNLSFNSISVLVPTLFDSLNQLEYLDLSHNDITSHWINDRLFKNLTQLHYLDLSFNKLSVFSSPMTFSSLQQLETLSLQHNELRQVPETIQHLHYLSSLDLSQNSIHDITNASYLSNCRLLFNLNLESNHLENITRDAFSDLPALKVLNLANNRIHHLDQQAFEDVPDLHALRLDSNRLIDFGQAFVNLRFLLMLNISSNRISSFDYAQIPLGLQWLDLHSNRIDKLNNFYYSPSAQQQFSANDINNQQQVGSLGQQWQSMLRLTTLDASFNLIRELDNTSLPESLETVQLNNNQIRTIASHTFSTKSNLTRINLSHNQLAIMPFDALRMYRDTAQQQQQKFVDIYLANNPFICSCNMGWLSQLLLASSNLLQQQQQGGSSISGANLLGTLTREHIFTDTYGLVISRQLPRVADASQIHCHLPFGRQSAPFAADPHQWSPVMAANQLALHHNHHLHTSRDTPLILKQSELLSSVHLCPYKSHCFALCFCCDFDACDCEMSCPENCSCYYNQTWSTNIVDCSANNQINGISQARFTQMMMGASSQGSLRQTSSASQHQPQVVRLSSIPEKIPMDVTELYLDGLELHHLRGNALIGRRFLKSLYLNNSQVYSIEPRALVTQKALRVLQLNSNQLSELQGHEFEQQVELRELYLAHNRLVSIANTTFAPLKSLQILHLQGNQLYHMNFRTNIPSGHKLISMNLGQNPWSCQCDYIGPMLEWLHSNIKHLHDRKSIGCQYNRTTSLHLLPPLIGGGNSMIIASEDYQLSSNIYGSLSENYPLFDMRYCLNYTVFPMQPTIENRPTIIPNPEPMPLPQPMPQPPPLIEGPSSDDPSIPYPPDFSTPGSNGPMQPLEPFNPDSGEFSTPRKTTFQQAPNNSNLKSGQLLPSFSFLLMLIPMILIIIVAALPLIHYRRSMRKWFYSNYGLNIFATKSAKHHHHHGVGSLGKHNNHAHLHQHPYGVSSAGSTSSSSAASSNLSQALCQQQLSNGSPNGLVTTPLIVSNSNTASNHQILNTAPYTDDSKLFDAYLTYSKLDEQFVNDYLAPGLESGQPSYRVALHYRDLPATTSEFLTDCIIETANASRRIVMVLSEQLLKTEWMRYEFRAAHLEALRNGAGNARHRLIVVLLGQQQSWLANLADPELVQWLKSCTCIQWGEKMFWQRLQFAMPEQQQQQQQQRLLQQQQHCLRYQTLAPHQTTTQITANNHLGNSSNGTGSVGAKLKSNLGAASFLKSTGLFGAAAAASGVNDRPHLQSAIQQQQQQQLITGNHHPMQQQQHHHQQQQHHSLARPLPQPMAPNAASQASIYNAEEHHYAHLTPATMIYNNQQRQQMGQTAGYHQPIYGDPAQQQQQQSRVNSNSNNNNTTANNNNNDNPTVPVHI